NLLLRLVAFLLNRSSDRKSGSAGMPRPKSYAVCCLKKKKTRPGAQLMTNVLGILIFIDYYFNSLTVGQVAKPVTYKHRISRAKLSYIVDSTSAPVSLLEAISTWETYTVSLHDALPI